MRSPLALALLLISGLAEAGGRVRLDVEYEWFYGKSRFLELPKNKVDKYFALNAGIPILFLEWRNRVWALGEQNRVSWVGYDFQVVLPLRSMEFYYHHHSQHRLDDVPAVGFFPVQDSVGFRWRILK